MCSMYGIHFDPASPMSQFQQLVNQLRDKITQGELAGGSRLGSSRDLARSLAISRTIVLEAFEQLRMEGYLEGRPGSGTYVRSELLLPLSAAGPPARDAPRRTADSATDLLSFVPGLPDTDLFPRRKWLDCYRRAVEYADTRDLSYAPPGGRRDLRETLAKELYRTKGIHTNPESIFITAGSSQAIAMLAQCFPSPRVALEDPQAEFVYRIFRDLGCGLSLIPVDEQGIVDTLIPNAPVDLLYTTPSHQFPLGGTLSAERRITLLQKAKELGAWIVEDDFDSEFRYLGRPITPLQVMAPERVVYIGSFSKTVSPALRLGFAVLPPGLVQPMRNVAERRDLWLEGLQQKAMALFIREGHLERHIARAHRAYRAKNQFLRRLVQERLAPAWRISGDTTGMHLVLNFSDTEGRPADVGPIISRLRQEGLLLHSASSYCRGTLAHTQTLLVAYGRRSEAELSRLVNLLADALAEQGR